MYTYEYESVEVAMDGWGPLAGNNYSMTADHRAIIQARAQKGWRYVGYIPTRQRGTGHIQQLDLIFEKEL